MDKKSLSGRDICSKYIGSVVQQAGWNMHKQLCSEARFMALCDQLKTRLTQARQFNEQ